MPDFSNLPEVFLSNASLATVVSREVRAGRLRKLVARVYTRNLVDSPEIVVQAQIEFAGFGLASCRCHRLTPVTFSGRMLVAQARAEGMPVATADPASRFLDGARPEMRPRAGRQALCPSTLNDPVVPGHHGHPPVRMSSQTDNYREPAFASSCCAACK